MRTAIVSDLHIASASGRDLLCHQPALEALLDSIVGADRVVLLGDTLDFFEAPEEEVLEQARPFFEALAETVGVGEVILVPGNHDHRLAEPILAEVGRDRRALTLEERGSSSSGLLALDRVFGWLGPASPAIAYPGIWLRPDVYATHGHYMDCYRRLPRLECVAAAARMRTTRRPLDRPRVEDYERILRPIYRLAFGLAQVGVTRRVMHPSERAWRELAVAATRPARPDAVSRLAPRAVGALNRLLDSEFTGDFSYESVTTSGADAAKELFRHLHVEADHVIVAHTHRAGPLQGEEGWRLESGALLHNTGSWMSNTTFGDPPPEPFRPGSVTWVEEAGRPSRVNALSTMAAQA